MTIHGILAQGHAEQLGPITVSRCFPPKAGAKNIFMLVEDSTGKSALKIWAPPGTFNINDGDIITLTPSGPKGGLKVEEYPVGSGKTSINANDCTIEVNGAPSGAAPAPAAASAYQAPAAAPAAVAAHGGDKLEAVMKRCAQATALYVDELVVNRGYTKDEAIMLAQNAPAWFPLFWFGEKGVN